MKIEIEINESHYPLGVFYLPGYTTLGIRVDYDKGILLDEKEFVFALRKALENIL